MHVRTETRKVYVSARGAKLTKHAAYIAAAKKMIANRCMRWDDARLAAAPESYEPCSKTGAYQCRFHKRHEPRAVYYGHGDYDQEGGGMEHYVKVLPRLVRFLKFADARAARTVEARG